MALPSSGAIAFANVNTELGAAAGTMRSLNDSAVRSLFAKASGQISMSDGYGKSSNFVFNKTISTDTANYNLRADAIANGWNGTAPLIATITISSGIVVYANSTSAYAFDTGVSFPAGTTLALVNNGYIIGMGGVGASGNSATGNSGGPALRAQQAISINNSGTIGGGGGGGGGGGFAYSSAIGPCNGGGGGGGRSGRTNATGGAGAPGEGPGGAGTFAGAGGGGPGNGAPDANAGDGGSGGNWGAAGGAGGAGSSTEGGASGGGAGGAGGNAVVGNAFITWNATGALMGTIA